MFPRPQLCLHFLVLCGLAFALRHLGWNWDEGQLAHPDERHLVMVTAVLERPASTAEWLDTAHSPFNPHNCGVHRYVYGIWPLRVVHDWTVARGRNDYAAIVHAGRLFSALFATGTVAVIYLLGLRLVSPRFASVTALASALCVLCIQQAHFFTVDSAAAFFSALCVAAGLLAVREERPWLLLPAGLAAGAAAACRINLALLTVWLAVVALSLMVRRRSPRPLLPFAAGLLCGLALFRFWMPYAFVGGWIPSGLNPRWLEDLQEVWAISHGVLEVPFTLQWAGRMPYAYALSQLLAWGMGPALGLTALAGSALLLWGERRRPGSWQILLLLWPLLLTAYHGRIFLHTQRYFLPAYPWWILGGFLGLWQLKSAELRRWLCGLTLVGAALHTFAFQTIYREPHPWVEASNWIYRRLPAGGRVLGEHWDHPLPLPLPGSEAMHARLELAELPVYDPESPEKLRRLLREIEAADYLVLSSTRASHSLTRLPQRYPVMDRFYRRLAEGENRSGLREVARFQRQPRLAGWGWNTLKMEEAFHVYDQPLVRIYEKTPVFSVEALYQVLTEDLDFATIPAIASRDAGRWNGGWLTPEQWERRERHGQSWQELFPDDSVGNQRPIFTWVLALVLLGLITLPLAYNLFPHLPDRGLGVSRLLGLTFIAFFAWLPAALEVLPFHRALGLACLLLFAVAALRTTLRPEPFFGWLRQNYHRLLLREALLWTVFAFFLWLRWLQPELWHPWAGGEKPMDFAFLAATAKTPFFPPAHPWLAGAFVNYYYYGFVLTACLIRLTGISPDLAYNLALPTFAMFTAGGALSLVECLFPVFRSGIGRQGRRLAAGLTLFLTLLAGNLGQLRQLIFPGAAPHPRDIYWNASRVIQVPPGEVPPITEFPFFSFLYGDLHAHLMAMPLAMLCLLCSWQLARRFHPLRLLAAAGLIGSLWAVNAWDLPAQAVFFILACLAPALQPGIPNRFRRLIEGLGWAVGGLLLARMAFAPFHRAFAPPPAVFKIWTGPQSSFFDLLLAHGLLLLPILLAIWHWRGENHRPRFRAAPPRARAWAGLLTGGCVLLILLLEWVHLESDVGRMNSVFKFYFQIWWLLAPLTALALTALLRPGRHPIPVWQRAMLIALLLGGVLFPLTALPGKLRDRGWANPPRGLDGLAWMQEAVWQVDGHPLPLAGNRAGIDWLRKHAGPMDIILEAERPVYEWGGRMAWHTGLPGVLGWASHVQQQRPRSAGDDPVTQRSADIQFFYTRANLEQAREILQRYQVRYVIDSTLERISYPRETPSPFSNPALFENVFERGGMRILRVKE